MTEKQIYEKPQIEVVEFEMEEAIAVSGAGSGSFWGTIGSEEIWGD